MLARLGASAAEAIAERLAVAEARVLGFHDLYGKGLLF